MLGRRDIPPNTRQIRNRPKKEKEHAKHTKAKVPVTGPQRGEDDAAKNRDGEYDRTTFEQNIESPSARTTTRQQQRNDTRCSWNENRPRGYSRPKRAQFPICIVQWRKTFSIVQVEGYRYDRKHGTTHCGLHEGNPPAGTVTQCREYQGKEQEEVCPGGKTNSKQYRSPVLFPVPLCRVVVGEDNPQGEGENIETVGEIVTADQVKV